MALSVVIITKNEAHIIGKVLHSLQGLTNNIIIVDNGSTDSTLEICEQYNAVIIKTAWVGYGANKNMGIDAAANDWILSLDADETIDDELRHTLEKLLPGDEKTVYQVRRKNFFCGKWVRHGEWASDKTIRVFNRNVARWSDDAVHESLLFSQEVKVVLLKGNLLHYTVNNRHEYMSKTIRYAKLSAQKYFENKKKVNPLKLYLAPVFSFLKHYIFQLGFLDGEEGLIIARTTARYTFLKYNYLKEMKKTKFVQ